MTDVKNNYSTNTWLRLRVQVLSLALENKSITLDAIAKEMDLSIPTIRSLVEDQHGLRLRIDYFTKSGDHAIFNSLGECVVEFIDNDKNSRMVKFNRPQNPQFTISHINCKNYVPLNRVKRRSINENPKKRKR